MSQQEITLVGLSVGDYRIESLIGEGAFSWVYRGIKLGSGDVRAFKAAKPPQSAGRVNESGAYPTEALVQATGWCTNVVPNTYELLYLQAAKLELLSDPGLVAVEHVFRDGASCHCRMELLDGHSLRELMKTGPVPVSTFLEIARCMERIHREGELGHHGDLKPENIIITSAGVKIIDPGHFGMLELADGNREHVVVTTPAYYPLLEPDDLLALGLILWEAALGFQPLARTRDANQIDSRNVGPELLQLVRRQETLGRKFLSPILGLSRPSAFCSKVPPELEALLLKALGLTAADGLVLEKAERFASFGDLADVLEELLNKSVVVRFPLA